MFNRATKIGRIVKISGMRILVEITEKTIVNNLQNNYGNVSFPISLNKLVFSNLPNYKKIIGRITGIVDKNLSDDFLFETNQKNDRYIMEVSLIGIFDEYLESFDVGINLFPIIGSEVFALPFDMENRIFSKRRGNYLEIGRSYNNLEIIVKADIDILFGKHLGVFGNTGTGKTCTIVSIIQGLKNDRLKILNKEKINISPKIIIFDANNEYEKAFSDKRYKYKIIKKEDLNLPHSFLSNTEYYKFLNASGGIQAPVLKEAISNLKRKNNKEHFKFSELPDEIENVIKNRTKGDSWAENQWKNWVNPLLNRIEVIMEDERLYRILEYNDEKQNTVSEILEDDNKEIFIIEADFDKEELDIIVFLFSKILYNLKIKNEVKKNIVMLFEEAHRYINEEDKNDYKLGSYYIERLAREGRKFGISLIISSQRPSELSKTVISQCNSYIVHRLTNKNDLEVINKLLGINYKNLLDIVPILEKQNALVLGEAFVIPEIVKLFDANPLPASHDPEVLESWKIKDNYV